MDSSAYLMTVRCSSVCEVWRLPAQCLVDRMQEQYPLIWGAIERIDPEVLSRACIRQFEDPTFLSRIGDWPSSVGIYLPPKEQLTEWRRDRHKQLRNES